MIKIIGEYLYQWDSNRQVYLDGEDAEAETAHFANSCSLDNALVVEVKEDEEGHKVADIPNSLLVNGHNIWCWTWATSRTLDAVALYVTRRNKPSDYIYTPTEVVTIESLKEWVREELESMKDIIGNNNYINLENKPSIEGVELIDDRKLSEFGILLAENSDIDSLFE